MRSSSRPPILAEQQTQDAPARFEPITGLEQRADGEDDLQDKRVLYVSQTRARARRAAGRQATSASPGSTRRPAAQIDSVIIVFAGTDQDAEVIKFAQRDQSSRPADRGRCAASTERHGVEEATTGITFNILVEEYGVPIPDIIVLATNEPAAAQPIARARLHSYTERGPTT